MSPGFQTGELIACDKIFSLQSKLRDYIEPDAGLLDELLSREVLTNEQCARIRAQSCGVDPTVFDKTDRLLSCLLDNEQTDYDLFMTCLENTDQKHVVNYINNNGG